MKHAQVYDPRPGTDGLPVGWRLNVAPANPGEPMKRDMEIVFAIMDEVETWAPGAKAQEIHLEGYDDEAVQEHVNEMIRCGYLRAATHPGCSALVYDLTWTGPDLSDLRRVPGVWDSVKQKLGDRVSTVPLDTLMRHASDACVEWLKSVIG